MEFRTLFAERMVCLVPPGESGDSGGNLRDEIGLMQDDVSPELDFSSIFCREFRKFAEKIQIDAMRAPFFAQFPAASVTELDGFIAADVQCAAREVREKFGVEPVDESERSFSGRKRGLIPGVPLLVIPWFPTFGEVAVLLELSR